MRTYIIKTKGKELTLRSYQNIQSIKTSPALFFVTDGDFQIQECGRVKALKQINSHIKSLLNSWGVNNG